MNINGDVIDFGASSPMNFSIHEIGKIKRHWHQSIELLYILSGSVQIKFHNMQYNLREDDIILINMFDVHSLAAAKCEVVSLKIDISALDPQIFRFSQKRFECNSSTEADKTKFTPLKCLLASIVKSNANPDENIELMNKSCIYELLYILTTYFKVEENYYSKDIVKNSERIKSILNFINEKYASKISLNILADTLYLSKSYLSKVFKEFIGVSFGEYLTDVRISHAVNDLVNLNLKVDYIAEKNGFPNSRSFVTAFKNKYNVLPSKYRSELNHYDEDTQKNTIEGMNYLDLRHNDSFNRLAEYLNNDTKVTKAKQCSTVVYEISPIDAKQKGLRLRHTFKTLTCIGKAKHILISENQHMLSELQRDIGFHYIRFHGLLDDEMMFYSENDKGEPKLSFIYIDLVIDYLLSINLKPFMELSFMPSRLASDCLRTMFFISSVISLPKDMKKWTHVIRQLTLHLITRYGKKEVESWPFFLWNEPDAIKMFGFENYNDFFIFYLETYKAIKDINSSIQFGSPPVFGPTLAGANDWMDKFIDFCKSNDCMPDFINTHFYPMNLSFQNAPTISMEKHLNQKKYLAYNESKDALKDNICSIRKRMKENNWKVNKLYLIAWNSSISHNELLNDTAYKAAYIAKNLSDNYDNLESFGYWQISDLIEEVKLENQLYHGGGGLFTYNGIKKSHYYVFQMFSKLGERLLGKGEGFFITTKDDSIQIILFNYQHYSKLYASGQLFDMTFENRYTPFPKPQTLKVVLPIINLDQRNYQLTETIINQKYGSSFDKWIELGGLPLETAKDVEYLKAASIPKIQKKILCSEENSLIITAELMPHEVRLIEIKPLYGDKY
ncbi:GH39 family glycosyl hydrolase [Clostridium sp.]